MPPISSFFGSLSPLLALPIFLVTFLGSGAYYAIHNYHNAWYLLSPNVAILPALVFLFHKSKVNFEQTFAQFIQGMQDKNILTMCCVFLSAGAFGEITKCAGCTETASEILLYMAPASFLLPGIFLMTACIATAIGSSMGVIATIGPLVVALSDATNIPMPISIATVVGGAMFGDNLSLISDTTIASVQALGASPRQKFMFNLSIASIASIITCSMLYSIQPPIIWHCANTPTSAELLKISPYLAVIWLSFRGMHVIKVLSIGTLMAGLLVICEQPQPFTHIAQAVNMGIEQLCPITLLSLEIAGISALIHAQGGFESISERIKNHLNDSIASKRKIELLIVSIVSIYDICIANNTIAILLSAPIANDLTVKFNMAKEKIASWLGIFACIFQGIIPYGAQILLASALSQCSPLQIVPYVWYCFSLLLVSMLYILLQKDNTSA